jgi:hypothetical protein
MSFRYTEVQRAALADDAKGKTIAAMTWEPEGPGGGYWVLAFTDGTEMSVRLMAELRPTPLRRER